jgi:hypothetical protein
MREDAPEQPEHELSDSICDTDTDDSPAAEVPGATDGAAPARTRAIARWLRSNGWLILAAAALLTLTRVVEFEPPEEVRVDDASVDLVGEAPQQEFSSQLANPQAVQLRGTLRLYPRTTVDVREPDPELDAKARILSQPVVTTIYAMSATIDQSVRLDGGELEIDVSLVGTPRLGEAGRNKVPELSLEHELTVTTRQRKWLGEAHESIQLHTRGTLTDLEDRPYRWVFLIEGKLFALDLELNRAV